MTTTVIILWGTSAFLVAYLLLGAYYSMVDEVNDQKLSHPNNTLSDIYLGMSEQVFFGIRIVLTALFFVVGYLLINAYLGILLASGGFFVPQLLLARAKHKRVKRVETQLIEGLELLGNALKSGLTLAQAVELLVKEFPPPISQEFSVVLAENRLGVDFNDALQNMAVRLNSNVLFILASGVAITKRCGGDLTIIFQNIANVIREQAKIEGKLDAVTAQGRFQGLILGIMPFALIIVLYFVDRTHVETLFGYQIGIWAVTSVVVMVVLAQLWIRKLMAIDV